MATGYLIWIAAFAWLLYRQVQRRAIGGRRPSGRGGRRNQIAVVLVLIGAVQLADFAKHHHLDATSIVILCVSFLIGAGLGIVRGLTVRLTVEAGQLFRQGTAATVALWLVAVGLHLGSERLIQHEGGPAGAGSATMLLYLALSLTIQTQVLRRRARTALIALRGERVAATATAV